jgi:hypothetical protein
MHWQFIESPEGALDQGIRDGDYEYFGKTRYSSLVRESIQNSLDAADEPENPARPVTVKFRFERLTKENFDAVNLSSLLTIRQRIEAYIADKAADPNSDKEDIKLGKAMLASVDKFRDSIDVLIISDFNTHGMSAAGLKGFVTGRNSSIKRKDGSAGSKGMGKAVYYALSSFRTILVSTTFGKNKDYAFTGVSKLANHTFKGKKYSHLGYWSSDPPNFDSIFWNIPPACRRDDHGTSFFILAPWEENKENRLDQMKAEVLVNFWLSIQAGKLIVSFFDENGTETEIKKDTLVELFRHMAENSKYRKAVQNAEHYFTIFQKEAFAIENLARLGNVKLYLDRDPKYQGKIAHFRQSGMLIFEEGSKYGLQKGMAGIFYCPDEPGNTALKHLENAAHNEWKSTNLTDDEGRAEGKKVIEALNEFIREKVKEFRGVDATEDFRIEKLNNYFGENSGRSTSKVDFGNDEEKKGPGKKTKKPPGPHNRFISGLSFHLLSASNEGKKTRYRFIFEAQKRLDRPSFLFYAGSDNERLSSEVMMPIEEITITDPAGNKLTISKSEAEIRRELREMAGQQKQGKKLKVLPFQFPDLPEGKHKVELVVADELIHSLNVRLVREI